VRRHGRSHSHGVAVARRLFNRNSPTLSTDRLEYQDWQAIVTGVPDGVTVTGDPFKLTSSTFQTVFPPETSRPVARLTVSRTLAGPQRARRSQVPR
jgi:hypothetical protein